MHFLVRAQERFSMGDTVDSDERGQGTAEIHDHQSVNGMEFGMGEKRIGLAPGSEGGS